jgi:large subunit ribosomal protein L12
MEYIYAALLLHKAGKKVDEHGVKAVLTAAGVAADESRIKALIAALDGVNIEEAISKAAVAQVAVAAPAAAGHHAAAPAKEEHKEEDKKQEEESGMAGLGALFG